MPSSQAPRSQAPRPVLAPAFAALVLQGFLLGAVSADPWPHWRGPRLDGISLETGIPTKWTKTENVAWRLPLPGPAGSTPVVWGERIFLTTVDGADLKLLCASTDGKILWSHKVADGNKDVRGDEGNYASPSPVTDGEHVCAFFANGVLACFDMEGKQVWRFDLQERYGKFNIAFGLSSTPLLDEGRLYVQLIHGAQNEQPSRATVICLDKATGDEVWKHDRNTPATHECKHSYASPTIYRDSERAYLISHGADYTIAHDLKDGGEIWRLGLNNPGNYHKTLRFVASPLAVPGIIVVPTAKNGQVVAVRPDARGDITESKEYVLWRRERGTPDVPSPLVHEGLVYLCRENGNLVLDDAASGENVYEERTVRDRHRASPLLVDGKIYLTSRKGVVTVVKPGREFEILAQNDLGEPMTASPVVSGGTLYLRTFEALYAVRNSGNPGVADAEGGTPRAM